MKNIIKDPSDDIQARIEGLIVSYYRDYYQKVLGLSDYKERIQKRLREDESHEKKISLVENILNYKFDISKKVLVVGGGTGAEFIALNRRGCDVYTIEPNKSAVEILKLKLKREGISLNKIRQDYAENISFQTNFFDFVYCFTVLEHVSNITEAIKEMIRVTKKNGYIFICCPDYRHIYEQHYKTYLPLFLPRWIIKGFLRMKGRPTDFLYSLRFVNANKLRNIFRNCNVISMQICFPYTADWLNPKGWNKITKFLQDRLGISRDQYWFLKKQ